MSEGGTCQLLCVKQGVEVLPTSPVVEVAHDGCDKVDVRLHALKSGGIIHTQFSCDRISINKRS